MTPHARETHLLMAQLPPVGDMVTITMVNSSPVRTGPLAHLEGPTFDLKAKLIRKPSWDKDPDNFAVFIPNSPVQVRIVRIWNVVAVNGTPLTKKEYRVIKKEFRVAGSKGGEYVVSFDGHAWSCTCPGFNFRKTCRHIAEKRDKS